MAERETRQAEAESEPQRSERWHKTIVRPRRASSHGQLAQRSPSQEEELVPRSRDDLMRPQSHHDRHGAPAVRLDMDLDVDIQLKARIKGTIELSILGGEQPARQRRYSA
ncbi:hypothetical protein VTK26DRAFT_2375 [Humicola hyalothermophila]